MLNVQTVTSQGVHDMKTDPLIIYHFIKSQAGSLGKAFMELVQNSIDAGATSINLTFDQFTFCIEDNGEGFGDAEAIHRNFGTFGTPHTEGDSRFGRFRLGRGQIMAFAKTLWHTPGYVMDVDVQNRGLNYILTPAPYRAGVKITGTFYKPVDGDSPYQQSYGAELDRAVREVSDLVKYADIDIIINGKKVNQNPHTMKWDFEDDDAYYDFKASGSFRLYNEGFLVRDYPSSTYGSAVVVTKKHLRLNMARNQVLENECPIWARVTKTMKKRIVKSPSPTRMTDDTRAVMSNSLRFGELDLDDVKELRIITLVTGSTVTVDSMVGGYNPKPLASAPKGHGLGQRVHSANLAYVIADETMARFGCTTIREFQETILAILERDRGPKHSYKTSWEHRGQTSIYEAGKMFLTANEVIETKTLNPTERTALQVIEGLNYYMRLVVGQALGRSIPERKIVAGDSESAYAWTDGRSYIAFSRVLLDQARHGTAGWTHIIETFAHEYVHDDSDGEVAYVHSTEFYETMHNVLGYNKLDPKKSVYGLVENAVTNFYVYMERKGKKTARQKKFEATKVALEELAESI